MLPFQKILLLQTCVHSLYIWYTIKVKKKSETAINRVNMYLTWGINPCIFHGLLIFKNKNALRCTQHWSVLKRRWQSFPTSRSPQDNPGNISQSSNELGNAKISRIKFSIREFTVITQDGLELNYKQTNKITSDVGIEKFNQREGFFVFCLLCFCLNVVTFGLGFLFR